MATTSLLAAMSSNTEPAPYVASASTYYASSPAYKAFNKNAADQWLANVGNSTGWLQIDLGAPAAAQSYDITPPADLTRAPVNWTVEGSPDGAAWTVLDTRSGVTWPSTARQGFAIATPSDFRLYRLNVTANNGGSYLAVAEWDLLGVPSGTSVTLTGAAPSVTGSFGVAGEIPPTSVTLTGAAPSVTGSFGVEQAGVGILDLAGTAPGAFGSLEVVAATAPFEVATDSVNRLNGMTLVTEWQVDVEPPVTEPKRQRAHDYAIAVSLTEPTLVDGRPT